MVLDSLQVAVDVIEVVVDGCRLLYDVLGGFRSFHVLVPTHKDLRCSKWLKWYTVKWNWEGVLLYIAGNYYFFNCSSKV